MAVVGNPGKSPLLPIEVRTMLISKVVEDLENVRVGHFQGLLVDFANQSDSKVIIRGLRAISDYEAELGMAQANRQLNPELETIFS